MALKGNAVSYIPYTTRHRDSDYDWNHTGPWLSSLSDIKVLLANLAYVPLVVFPLGLAEPLPGVKYNYFKLYRDYGLDTLLVFLEILLLPLVAVGYLVLPGFAFLLCCLIISSLILGVCRIMWGPLMVMQSANKLEKDQFQNEAWVFVNGIGTSYCMLQTSLSMISSTFQRRVEGIHNRSFGVVLDVLNCLLQRSFRYQTSDTHNVFIHLRQKLEDSKIDKVVVIAHSQGGMVTSLAMDRLYTHLPAELMSKLEVYTFGSAASFIHNPVMAKASRHSRSSSDTAAADLPPPHRTADRVSELEKDHYVSVIEHYCNGDDIVPRWGVLYHIRNRPVDSYAGQVFIHDKQPGHLFDQHYLVKMFPAAGVADTKDLTLFLNHHVVTDPVTKIVRATTGDRQRLDETSPLHLTDIGEEPLIPAGATVRDLSKLWRYINGGTP